MNVGPSSQNLRKSSGTSESEISTYSLLLGKLDCMQDPHMQPVQIIAAYGYSSLDPLCWYGWSVEYFASLNNPRTFLCYTIYPSTPFEHPQFLESALGLAHSIFITFNNVHYLASTFRMRQLQCPPKSIIRRKQIIDFHQPWINPRIKTSSVP